MACKTAFLDFARQAMVRISRSPARHHELLIERLQAVADGSCDRLMVQMPPGSAKSTYGSVLFPTYFLSQHDNAQIIATAHTASLADYFGRHVRNTVQEHAEALDLKIIAESRASSRFVLKSGGEYFGAGVRGPITGRRADLILIDDPIKSWAEAESQTARDALFDWFRAELSARLKPGGRIVLIMTRWHEDDLAGRLMATEPSWNILKLPAFAEAGDPLGRQTGEVLWPEWQDHAAIERRRREVGERAFSALYQQCPRPPDEALFRADRVGIIAQAPIVARTIRAWDLASSLPKPGRHPDYTVGLKLGETDERKFFVLDVIRFQGSASQVEEKIITTAKVDGTGTLVALPQDPGQAGAAQISMLSRGLAGFNVSATPETGAKVLRAKTAAKYVDAGDLWLVAAPWNDSFLAELSAFPDSPKDDQVDALSRAFNTLETTSFKPARRVNIPFLAR